MTLPVFTVELSFSHGGNSAEQDRHRNELDENRQSFIYQSTRELIEELSDISTEERKDATAGNSKLDLDETEAIDRLLEG
jgi:hypothetical protein